MTRAAKRQTGEMAGDTEMGTREQRRIGEGVRRKEQGHYHITTDRMGPGTAGPGVFCVCGSGVQCVVCKGVW